MMAKRFFVVAAFAAASVNGLQLPGKHYSKQVGGIHKPARVSPLFQSAKSSSNPPLVPSLPAWDPTNWTPKRIWNTQLFRSGAILGALVLAFLKSPLQLIPARAAGVTHVLSFGAWFGTVFYTTFIAGITMYRNLPRQTFGKLQSKLFPQYFNLCSWAILLQILTSKTLGIDAFRGPLLVALVMTCLNQFYLEPTSTEIMLARYELENKEGGKETDEYKKLAASFGKFHGISSLTNLVALIAAVTHGVALSGVLVGV